MGCSDTAFPGLTNGLQQPGNCELSKVFQLGTSKVAPGTGFQFCGLVGPTQQQLTTKPGGAGWWCFAFSKAALSATMHDRATDHKLPAALLLLQGFPDPARQEYLLYPIVLYNAGD